MSEKLQRYQDIAVARDVMTPNPICGREGELLKDYEDIFNMKKITTVPILNDQGKITGILSKTDVQRTQQLRDMKEFLELVFTGSDVDIQQLQEFFHLDSYDEVTLCDIMTEDFTTVKETTLVRDLAKVMFDTRLHRVVVLNEFEQVVGMVSALDIVHLCFSQQNAMSPQH